MLGDCIAEIFTRYRIRTGKIVEKVCFYERERAAPVRLALFGTSHSHTYTKETRTSSVRVKALRKVRRREGKRDKNIIIAHFKSPCEMHVCDRAVKWTILLLRLLVFPLGNLVALYSRALTFYYMYNCYRTYSTCGNGNLIDSFVLQDFKSTLILPRMRCKNIIYFVPLYCYYIELEGTEFFLSVVIILYFYIFIFFYFSISVMLYVYTVKNF